MKKIALGDAQFIIGIEQTDKIQGRETGYPMLTFRKVGDVGAKVGGVVNLPMEQIKELTVEDESFAIIFSNPESVKVVSDFMELLTHGSVNTIPND